MDIFTTENLLVKSKSKYPEIFCTTIYINVWVILGETYITHTQNVKNVTKTDLKLN